LQSYEVLLINKTNINNLLKNDRVLEIFVFSSYLKSQRWTMLTLG
jgi:hypothetical protein